MTAIDAERALRLDRAFDDVLRRRTEDGGREAIDADTVAALRELYALASRPVPDSAFVERLGEELVGSEVALPHRVIPPRTVIPHYPVILSASEESRLIGDHANRRPRSFVPQDDNVWRDDIVGAQNDPTVVHDSLPLPSLNGHSQVHSDTPSSPPWWQRWEIAAALLVIVALGGYLTLINLGRTVPALSRLSAITTQTEGTAPAELHIPAIGVTAPIEAVPAFPDGLVTPWAGDIWATGWRDGKPVLIPEPSAPGTVAWLDDSAAPGEGGNVVLYGHLEYWDTPHAAFWNLQDLTAGAFIQLTGANDASYFYVVEWIRRYPIDVDEAAQREILGPTNHESLTLITNAGEYDEKTGTYPEVLVVRAIHERFAPESIGGDEPGRLRIESIGVDAPIGPREAPAQTTLIPVGDALLPAETLDEDWILIPPESDPSTVAWRDDSAALGSGSNVVLEGPLDQSGTMQAVFGSLHELHPGDRIEVYGLAGSPFWYEVDWLRRVPIDPEPQQRHDILGPTAAESVTLITNAGEVDQQTGLYHEVLVVRAHLVGSNPFVVQAQFNPANCLTSPLPIDALEAVATVIAIPGQAPTPTPLSALTGERADGETIDAVINAERELVACLNANDPLRTYSLYTAKGLARLLQYMGGPMDAIYEWAPDFSGLAAPATPLPTDRQHDLLAVEDVSVLPDGRVAALVTIGPWGSSMAGVPTGIPVVHVFEPGDRYLIDEFYAPTLMGTPTP